MKNKFLIFSFCAILSINTYAQNVNTEQLIDLSSVDCFFEMKHKISLGKIVNEKDWDSLFETSGYKISATSSMRRSIIEEMMITAYDKKYNTRKDSILNISVEENIKNPYALLSQMTLLNYIDYSENEKELKFFRHNYDFLSIPKFAAERLKNFLINPVDSLIDIPKINFLCYEPDAQSKEKGIVCDFNLFYKETEEERINFIAHESFHKYRRKFIDKEIINSDCVLKEIDKLQDEGIADLIDKKENIAESISNKGIPEPFIKQYLDAHKNTPEILKEFDNIIVSYLKNEINKEELESKVNNFFLSGGHPNGYYMSRLIEKAGFKDEMLKSFYSPTEFIKIYNKAAQKENEYVFSKEFITYLESL